jgi:hypothetical protein
MNMDMDIHFSPVIIVGGLIMGAISAYLAHKREKNPYKWFVIGFLFGIFGVFAFFFATERKKQTNPVVAQPILKIQGPIDKFWYYIDPLRQQQGPMSRDALNLAWKEGKVDLSTYVWHEDLPEWKPLKETLAPEIERV